MDTLTASLRRNFPNKTVVTFEQLMMEQNLALKKKKGKKAKANMGAQAAHGKFDRSKQVFSTAQQMEYVKAEVAMLEEGCAELKKKINVLHYHLRIKEAKLSVKKRILASLGHGDDDEVDSE